MTIKATLSHFRIGFGGFLIVLFLRRSCKGVDARLKIRFISLIILVAQKDKGVCQTHIPQLRSIGENKVELFQRNAFQHTLGVRKFLPHEDLCWFDHDFGSVGRQGERQNGNRRHHREFLIHTDPDRFGLMRFLICLIVIR